jgi:serpin B
VPTPAAPDRHLGFACDLLRTHPAAGQDNAVVSPWSVSSALAALAPGCDAAARDEIVRALAPGATTNDLVAALAGDAAQVTASAAAAEDGSTLAVANTLWVDEGRTPSPAFAAGLERWPGAAVHSIRLAGDPEGARSTINADVAATTRELIPEILPAGSISPDDRAVIVNALYLLAAWLEPFSPDATTDEPFHAPSGSRDVPTMQGLRDAAYTAGLGGGGYLALPLWGVLRAEILLPPAGAAATVLDASGLDDLRRRATTHRVDLHLPRFRVSSAYALDGPLQRLGIGRVFDASTRPLPDVVVEEPLHISGAFHAAVLRADERGIEGAAATAMIARAVAYRELPEVEMRVDRPFLVLITHRDTGAVLFLARVAEP